MTSDQTSQPARHNLECAKRIRLRLLLEAGDPAHPPLWLLNEIANEIHSHCGHSRLKAQRLGRGWTVARAVETFHHLCKTQRLGARGLTERSWKQWEAGDRPSNDYQDLLCRLFQTGPVQLGFAMDYTPDQAQVVEMPAASPNSRQELQDVAYEAATADACEARHLARKLASSHLNDVILEQLDADVRQLAYDYVSKPLTSLFFAIRDLRSEVFALIEDNRCPRQMKHLYLIAGRLCGLATHVWLDQGQYAVAETQARTAWLCVDLAGHNTMRGWVRSVQSLIAYWNGRFDDAVALARDGRRYAADGTIAVRLPSLEARACAAMGDVIGTRHALDAAEAARGSSRRSEDDPAGVFTFPMAKQAAYAGTALLSLAHQDDVATAIQESKRAIELYETGSPEERSSGDLLAARLDLASAHLTTGDLDGMNRELLVALAVPPEQRIASIVKRALSLGKCLAEPRYRASSLAIQMREQIGLFCAQRSFLPPSQGFA